MTTTIKLRHFSAHLLAIGCLLVHSCNGLLEELNLAADEAKEGSKMAPSHNELKVDDRTLLDVFGQRAKEYLTTQLIPETSPECRWNWRHGRCEPHCDCHFRFVAGDFHLGRACRLRSDENEAPSQCDVPPDTPYAVIVKQAMDRTSAVKTKTLTSLANYKSRVQSETCDELPTECSGTEEENRRSLKQKLLCRHVPSPCDSEDNDTMARFVSPLANVSNLSTDSNGTTNNISNGMEENGETLYDSSSGDDTE